MHGGGPLSSLQDSPLPNDFNPVNHPFRLSKMTENGLGVNPSRGTVRPGSNRGGWCSFLYSSEVKTRSVARLTQEMIWEQFLILLKRLHLHCADGKQVHSFYQDPSPVRKASLRGDVECYRRVNCEQARVLPMASPRRGVVEASQQLRKSFPFTAAPAPGELRSAPDSLSREYPTSA